MIKTFNKLTFLIENKLKINLYLIYIITVIGTFLETMGIGIILPLLTIIVDGKEVINNFNSSLPVISSLLNFLKLKEYDELIIFLLSIVILVFLVKTCFFFFLINKQIKFAHLIESNLAKKFFNHYLKQNYSFHLSKNSSKLLSNITEEIKNFRLNLVEPFLVISTEIILLLAIITLLIMIEPEATISVSVILMIISYFYINFAKVRISLIAKKRQIHEALKIQHLKQGLNGIKEVKISGKEDAFLKIFHKHNLETVNSRAKLALWTTIPRYLLEFIGVSGICLLSILMVNKGVDLRSLLPTIGVFVVATFRLLPSAVRIVQASGKIRYGTPSANLLKEEIENSTYVKNFKDFKFSKNNFEKNSYIFESLKFNQVSFKYPNTERFIIKNLNLEINKGDKIGIIGPSGSGKSTFIDILTGLVKPTIGETILNNERSKINEKKFFSIIGYTPQFIFLTDDTIINNIAFGEDPDKLNIDQVKKSIKIAQLEDFISNSSEGLKTKIGEFGVRLSGGQRQRIGIARALYFQPQILILDESTSAVDFPTEEIIMKNINKLKDKTIIIVSHRLSSLKDCNKIFEIKNGTIEKLNLRK